MRRAWSEAELKFLTKEYPTRSTSKIAASLSRSIRSVYAAAHSLGLLKGRDFLASDESGQMRKGQTRPGSEATQFKKGQTPANKGLKRPGWHAGRMRETQFIKGNRTGMAATNWRPIGTISPDGEGYLRIKIREAVHGQEPTGFGNCKVWPMYGRYLWEQTNGPVPAKHHVSFKDRNRLNCDIGNLELVSFADMGRRNIMWGRMPPELSAVIQLNGALKRRIRSIYGKEQT